jgi:type II secretory pathway pseudopilin PulG
MHSGPGRHSIPGRGRLARERGYAMAALLVGMAVMAVMMTVALPVWSTAAKRAREDELVFRGEQYARAIGLFQRKYANALPPSIDVLINERFLRKKYLDPITGGEFQALTGAAGQATPGPSAPGRTGGPGGTGAGGTQTGGSSFGSPPASLNTLAQQTGGFGRGAGGGTAFGAAGGIVGVASKSTEKSLRLYNGRGAYNEWTFIAVQRQLQAGEGAGPGAQAPGGRGGQQGRGRGGERGTGPGRQGGGGFDSFRPAGGDGGRGFRPPTPGR